MIIKPSLTRTEVVLTPVKVTTTGPVDISVEEVLAAGYKLRLVIGAHSSYVDKGFFASFRKEDKLVALYGWSEIGHGTTVEAAIEEAYQIYAGEKKRSSIPQ